MHSILHTKKTTDFLAYLSQLRQLRQRAALQAKLIHTAAYRTGHGKKLQGKPACTHPQGLFGVELYNSRNTGNFGDLALYKLYAQHFTHKKDDGFFGISQPAPPPFFILQLSYNLRIRHIQLKVIVFAVNFHSYRQDSQQLFYFLHFLFRIFRILKKQAC